MDAPTESLIQTLVAKCEALQKQAMTEEDREVIDAAIYAVSGAKNQSRTYGHGDFGNPMCIEDGYMGEPYATRLVKAVEALKP